MSKHTFHTAFTAVALMAAFGSAGWAQQAQPVSQEGPQAKQTQPSTNVGAANLRKMFDRADKDGDGRLTRQEAKGWLPITYASFEQIDTDKRGWISFDQFVAFTNQRVQNQADHILSTQF